MQQRPLLISWLMRYGTTLYADREVVTWTGDGVLERGTARAAPVLQVAGALPGLGVTDDQRAATFMWNNAKHLIAYLATPLMGAVLHALNIRLLPEQLVYATRHAGNEVVTSSQPARAGAVADRRTSRRSPPRITPSPSPSPPPSRLRPRNWSTRSPR